MYAASSSLAADERADMRARINDARMVSRASFLPETLLSSTSASVNAELRTMTAEAGDLGAFADASAGTRGRDAGTRRHVPHQGRVVLVRVLRRVGVRARGAHGGSRRAIRVRVGRRRGGRRLIRGDVRADDVAERSRPLVRRIRSPAACDAEGVPRAFRGGVPEARVRGDRLRAVPRRVGAERRRRLGARRV